ncbi:hypothetical protein C8R46DRAFT_1187542 [Mycena filopes]|nr:hypothetical protein C8R46DRAFT_1187542 [Mycena filopes]
MAHLMASPFHKPSPFEFPHRSTSEETLPHAASSTQLPTPATTSIIGGQDPHAAGAEYFDTTPTASVADPGSRFRRAASSIVYHNSGLRESRERTVQRSSRSFVVVLPPPSFPQDHGHLGHTLSSGPRHRLSQGLLMPLFPTMYGQLTAIAREYNFPSTAGLCLYLHFTDNGITVTPRISDDSWQMIWSHAFDPAPGAAHHSLPISGKIEFDIDMRLARWYGAWTASSHREHVDVPMSVTPSAAPSVVHYRGDSRTTFADGDDQDTHHDAPPPRAVPRHVPRKLSLIDRFDTMSARSVPRSLMARPSPPDHHPGSQKMPPIFQEEEPKTAKHNLENRVNSWRASSSVLPSALAAVAAGHILLAEPDLPNSPPLDESAQLTTSMDDEQQEYEYRIEDYSFSISSAGPGDYDPYSPLDWECDPSVHLAHRAQGSVCMTPSYATSFGPSDYTLSDYVPSLDLNVRTPDIAHRMLEDVPPSPSIATSWGAPLSYPPSPTSEYRAPSVDLGHRQEFSRPTTPMTATSWGAPESYPPSPTTPFYVHTPDVGQRTFDLSALADHDVPWSLVWPYHDAARPWAQVWPYHSDQADAQAQPAGASNTPWNMVWPYTAAESSSGPVSVALPAVYPYLNIYPAVYPTFDIYPAVSGALTNTANVLGYGVYPHFDLYPAVSAPTTRKVTRAARGSVTVRLAPVYPGFDLYPATYPGNLDEIYPANSVDDASWEVSTRLTARYPSFCLYPAVYPAFEIYPSLPETCSLSRSDINTSGVDLGAVSYLYAPVALFAKRDLSSFSARSVGRGPVTIRLVPAYPILDLYPATYPGNLDEIYPVISLDDASWEISTRLAARYPSICLYPVVYPYFDIYPAPAAATVEFHAPGYPDFDIYSALSRAVEPFSRTAVKVYGPGYPDFDIYPALSRAVEPSSRTTVKAHGPGYPDFDIYPALSRAVELSSRTAVKAHGPGYPDFNIYPALSRAIEPSSKTSASHAASTSAALLAAGLLSAAAAISPAVSRPRRSPKVTLEDSFGPVSVRLNTAYPLFDLYPAVYPSLEIYPALPEDCAPGVRKVPGVSIRLNVGYPLFDLYPAVYPSFEIYPALPEDCAPGVRQVPGVSIRLNVAYPLFDLYPAVYPCFEIYPALPEDCAPGVREVSGVSIRLNVAYPLFDLYPAVYPCFEIYPALPEDCAPGVRQVPGVSIRLNVAYPLFDLYPAVYPCFEIYPALPEDCALGVREVPGVSIRLNVAYPLFDLYSAVYPCFEIYPALPEDCAPGVREVPGVSIRLNVGYPVFDLYPAVYPSFEIYPALPEDCAPGVRQSGVAIRLEPRYPYFNLYPAVYPYFELWPTMEVTMDAPAPRFPKSSRFTRSDLHALVQKSSLPLNPRRNLDLPFKSHEDLHLTVFPEGTDVSTPSGGVRSSPRIPSKTHLDLHFTVFPSDTPVSTPSGTGLKTVSIAAPTAPSTTSTRVPTRLRSGSVRVSLPPSPRPVGGRSPTTRAASSTNPPALPVEPSRRTAAPSEPLRRAVSTTTRSSVADRVALKGASLSRSVSVAAPSASVAEPTTLLTGPRAIPPRRRDSMVLQRVRAMQMNTEPAIKEDDPLATFPMPPRTSVARKVVS